MSKKTLRAAILSAFAAVAVTAANEADERAAIALFGICEAKFSCCTNCCNAS